MDHVILPIYHSFWLWFIKYSIHSFHIWVMVCQVFCCRAGETSSKESKIDSLGFRSNVITTSTKNGKVHPLLSHRFWSSWCYNENMDEWVPQMESKHVFTVSISDCLWHPFNVTTTTFFTKILVTTLPVAMMSAHTIKHELITCTVSAISAGCSSTWAQRKIAD